MIALDLLLAYTGSFSRIFVSLDAFVLNLTPFEYNQVFLECSRTQVESRSLKFG